MNYYVCMQGETLGDYAFYTIIQCIGVTQF